MTEPSAVMVFLALARRLRLTEVPFLFLLICGVFLVCPTKGLPFVTADTINEFGSCGNEAGMFREPLSFAIDEQGDIFVADTKNHRIQVFGPSGDFLFQWGKKGSDHAEFDYPSGIALGEGKVFIADTGNHRIQIFDRNGKYIDSFGEKGNGPKEFREPQGITLWNGFLYIADTENDRIQIFTEDGIFLAQINPEKLGTNKLSEPRSVSVDPAGLLYILEAQGITVMNDRGKQIKNRISGEAVSTGPNGLLISNRQRIYRYDFSLAQFFVSGLDNLISITDRNPAEMFQKITAIAVNSFNELYLLDSKKCTVTRLRTDMKPLDHEQTQIPSSLVHTKNIPITLNTSLVQKNDLIFLFDGNEQKLFSLAAHEESRTFQGKEKPAAAGTDNSLWLANRRRHRIEKYGTDGKLISSFGESGDRDGQFDSPSDTLILKDVLYVADTGNSRIQLFDLKGRFIRSFGHEKEKGRLRKPVALAFDTKDNLYIVDTDLNKIVKTDSSGNFLLEFGQEGKEDGEFRKPKGIAVIGEDIYVLDSRNNRVQVFDPNGRYLRKFGSAGKRKGEFSDPVSIRQDGKYRLYVLDEGNSRVQVFQLQLTPSAPEAGTAVGMIKEIKITWTAGNEPYVTFYRIFRKKQGQNNFEEIGKVNKAFTFTKYAYFDKKLESDTEFSYAVASVSQTGHSSAMSKVMRATTKRLVPSPPKIIKIEPGQKDIFFEWLPSPEPYTDHYLVLRNNAVWQSSEEVGKTKGPAFKDEGLKPNTLYRYMIVAVSIEGDRSEPLSVEAMTMKLPPIEVTRTTVQDIYSNNYKYYETNPFGKIILKNNSDNAIENIKISLMLQDYLDFPSETVIGKIEKDGFTEADLKAVFNNKLLSLTENSVLQSEITVSYFGEGEQRSFSLSQPLNIFEKHAMIWDKTEKASIFVTPKDPLLREIATKAIPVSASVPIHKTLLRARAVFAAMGLMGLTYLENPNNPYQIVSQNVSMVDYVQYPRETLQRKAGDCVDLVVLYASLLEGLGISTAFVTYPGHILLMFDTAVDSATAEDLGFPPADYVIFNNTVWLPVETTLVGNSFSSAWKKGMDEIREQQGKGLEMVEIKGGWQNYKPATLQYDEWRPEMVGPEKIEAAFSQEIETLRLRKVNHLISRLSGDVDSAYSLEQSGIIHGEHGMYKEAMDNFERYLKIIGENATVLNNIGNLYFLQGNYKSAETSYAKALKYDPRDPGILVNYARLYYRLGKKDKARKFLNAAIEIDSEVEKKYYYLSSELRK